MKLLRPFTFLIFLLVNFHLNGQYSINVGVGSQQIDGEVSALPYSANYGNVGISRQINRWFYLDGKIGYGHAKGQDKRLWNIEIVKLGLINGIYDDLKEDFNVLSPNFSTKYGFLDVGLGFKWFLLDDKVFLDLGIGVGFSTSSTNINMLNILNEFYENPKNAGEGYDTNILFDDTYETSSQDRKLIDRHYYTQVGFSYKTNERGYISFSARFHATNSDYFDSISYKSTEGRIDKNDIIRMLSLSYSYLIGGNNDFH